MINATNTLYMISQSLASQLFFTIYSSPFYEGESGGVAPGEKPRGMAGVIEGQGEVGGEGGVIYRRNRE